MTRSIKVLPGICVSLLVLGLLTVPPALAAAACNGLAATIEGTDGDDNIVGTAGNDVIAVGAGNDNVDGLGGSDTICGGTGDDNLFGAAGDDSLFGEAGDDTLYGEQGHDRLDGGPHSLGDWIHFFEPTVANLPAGTASGLTGEGEDTITGVESLSGSEGNDTLIGNGAGNLLLGGGGDDWLWARGGDDILLGDAGNDHMFGGQGDFDFAAWLTATAPVRIDLAAQTAVSGAEVDEVQGIEDIVASNHNDTLLGDSRNSWLEGGLGNDVVDGRGGFDVATFFLDSARVDASLQRGTAVGQGSDQLRNLEGLLGSEGDDVLVGNGSTNILVGALGADVMAGGGADDIFLVEGSDRVDGGKGRHDLVSYVSASAGVTVDLARRSGSYAGETNALKGVEAVEGSDFTDVITGNGGVNFLNGLGGNDRLLGRGGNDRLSGDLGRDVVIGHAGTDGCIGESRKSCETTKRAPRHAIAEASGAVLRQMAHRRKAH